MRHAVLYALACAVCVAHAKTEWRPTRNVDIVVAPATGGSSDRSARVLQNLRKKDIASVSFAFPTAAGNHNHVLIGLWDRAFARAVQSEDWKKDVQANAWAEDFMASAEARRHVEPNTTS